MIAIEKIKVIIADDHSLYLDGLKSLLDAEEGIEVVAQASNGRQLLQLADLHHPDVVVTDLAMPAMDGLEAIKKLHALGFQKIIALSSYARNAMIIDALESGAMGYLAKNAHRGEVVEAIRMVYEGQPYYCKSTNLSLIRQISASSFNPYRGTRPASLTEKETRAIRLIAAEKTSKEMASILLMSRRSVDRLRQAIVKKLGTKSPVGLIICALRLGIIDLDSLEEDPSLG